MSFYTVVSFDLIYPEPLLVILTSKKRCTQNFHKDLTYKNDFSKESSSFAKTTYKHILTKEVI